MDGSLVHLAVASITFVGLHFLMSGPFRPALVKRLGQQGFLFTYSLVSLVTFAWAVVAFDRADAGAALWDSGATLPWIVASVLTILALTLLLPSFAGNPALPGRKAAGLGTVVPAGIFTVTRHPMMWGFSLWAAAHIIAAPNLRVLIFMSAIIVLALVGSHLQDKRKIAENAREFAPWQRRTTYWPRLEKLARFRPTLLLALLVWFLATWIHYDFFGIPAGLWMWIG